MSKKLASKLTIDGVKEKLNIINANIEILSKEYVNNYSKLKCRCKICNYIWESPWSNLSRKHGCPNCSNVKNKKLSIDEIKERLSSINKNIEIVSNEYVNARTRLKCKCLIDGCVWDVTWAKLSQGNGCPECGKEVTKEKLSFTLDEVKDRLKAINPNIEILSNVYTNVRTKLKVKCLIDGHIWNVTWAKLSQGRGCPECAIRSQSGENNWNWKGGITPLYIHLRNTSINQWKKDSMRLNNYKCIITGNRFDDIHHLYGFDQIFQETMNTLNLPIYQEINKYTDDELNKIESKCLELHYKYGLGVTLTKEIHDEFHSIYGYGNNTPKQFEEFKLIRLK